MGRVIFGKDGKYSIIDGFSEEGYWRHCIDNHLDGLTGMKSLNEVPEKYRYLIDQCEQERENFHNGITSLVDEANRLMMKGDFDGVDKLLVRGEYHDDDYEDDEEDDDDD